MKFIRWMTSYHMDENSQFDQIDINENDHMEWNSSYDWHKSYTNEIYVSNELNGWKRPLGWT
jgi:hypothetical protein